MPLNQLYVLTIGNQETFTTKTRKNVTKNAEKKVYIAAVVLLYL